jgi:hypothetical protein
LPDGIGNDPHMSDTVTLDQRVATVREFVARRQLGAVTLPWAG